MSGDKNKNRSHGPIKIKIGFDGPIKIRIFSYVHGILELWEYLFIVYSNTGACRHQPLHRPPPPAPHSLSVHLFPASPVACRARNLHHRPRPFPRSFPCITFQSFSKVHAFFLHHPFRRHRFSIFGANSTASGSMFALSLLEHDLPIPPCLQSLPLIQAVKGQLEELFLDKVIQHLGLCVSVYGIKSADGGFILPGEGNATYKVTFRLVMFRPFVGEILIGKVEKCDDKGLQLSLGFFSDIYIPENLLKEKSKFNGEKGEGIWVWIFEDEEFMIHKNEEIRFRVHSIKYPPIPLQQKNDEKPFAPMLITGDILDDGLGLLSWW